eukprot:CAMPEP_0202965502 /NCGR_PEP_ID=MMETSP1396-20130829/9456_1 /ASSEMBLY_ACC=CAM_ASM_000872 /TAXON_ID= /ORGANISM="Pseudokeronopsis sp., Strain Brazil" /LENGTH=83 /DNA_ID=CAMNT_0049688235 /DNA_START=764 /DNA_END=1015 /DNA_ORIENTATION=+
MTFMECIRESTYIMRRNLDKMGVVKLEEERECFRFRMEWWILGLELEKERKIRRSLKFTIRQLVAFQSKKSAALTLMKEYSTD